MWQNVMHQTLAGSICCKKYGKIKQVEAHSLYTSTKEKGIYIHKLASKKNAHTCLLSAMQVGC